ncbi:MAG: YihY family inner membrane protein [Gammaproteobacteria bacterium]|nr:YihY family inner membrane protein [Gammaproteobacteria bacterium]
MADWQQRIRNLATTGWAFLCHLARRYHADGCQTRAAALTYVTLFAVVPLLTLTFAAFSLVPSLGDAGTKIQQLLLDALVPAGNPQVTEYLFDFARRARSLSTAGGLLLVVTTLFMLRTIERTFDHIWGIPEHRRGLADFLRYWAVLTLGPVLFGAGLALHAYLVALQALVDDADILGISRLILVYLPALLSWSAFTLLFTVVPHAPVPLRWALTGGLVTTGLLHAARFLFGAIVTNSNYHTVYGAFAALPLFLLWIHLCWLIVLGGAELVRALDTFNDTRRAGKLPDLYATLVAMELCVKAQATGTVVVDRDMVRAGLTDTQWRRLRIYLLDQHILAMTTDDGYVLARDPARISVAQLATLVPGDIDGGLSHKLPSCVSSAPWVARIEALLQASRDAAQRPLNLSLEELFDADQSVSPTNDNRVSQHA